MSQSNELLYPNNSSGEEMAQSVPSTILNEPFESSEPEEDNVIDAEGDDDDDDVEKGQTQQASSGLTIFTASVFVIGEMAGSGVLALPAAVSGAGWTGIVMLVLGCVASGYCGMVLGISWATLRKRHAEYRGHVRYPYPAIGEKAYGKWAAWAVTVCINITLIGELVVLSEIE